MKPKTALLLIGISVLAAGCSGRKPARDDAPPIRTYAVIPKQLNDPAFKLARDGAMAAAKEIGHTTIKWTAPQKNDPARQASILEDMIKTKVNGIAISCSDAAILKPAIDKAEDAGIPVVCFDSDSPDSKRLVFFGIDDRAAGRRLGQLLRAALPRGGDVAVLTGEMGAENLDQRVEGFKGAIANSNLHLITVFPCNGDAAKSVIMVRDYTRTHPNVKGWCMVGGWPLFTAVPGPFAGTNPGDVKVVAFDTLRSELEYVRQGYVTALVGQKYYEWGHTSVKMLDQLASGKEVPALVDSGMDIVTKDNLAAFEQSQKR